MTGTLFVELYRKLKLSMFSPYKWHPSFGHGEFKFSSEQRTKLLRSFVNGPLTILLMRPITQFLPNSLIADLPPGLHVGVIGLTGPPGQGGPSSQCWGWERSATSLSQDSLMKIRVNICNVGLAGPCRAVARTFKVWFSFNLSIQTTREQKGKVFKVWPRD